jgi:hypothetical protein
MFRELGPAHPRYWLLQRGGVAFALRVARSWSCRSSVNASLAVRPVMAVVHGDEVDLEIRKLDIVLQRTSANLASTSSIFDASVKLCLIPPSPLVYP